ncbi:hypothetical protein [Pseudonocardia sp. T1-2H]|uniref:hypothetical protein n=1 Tax=Pseudonocardia sp. T1-2H TaxID=3128899 RepID=UPI003101074A
MKHPWSDPAYAERVAAVERQERAAAKARHQAVVDRTTGLLRKVVAHHGPVDSGLGRHCAGCDPSAGYADEDAAWPCSTFDLIERGE